VSRPGDLGREALGQLAPGLGGDALPAGWERVPASAFARVARNPGLRLYYKEFLPRGPLERAKALLRGSRAQRARQHGEALLAAGFGAPSNVAWGALPGGREYLFTREAVGRDVGALLRRRRGGAGLHTRRRLLRELGSFVGRLHAAGFVHGDLRPGNVLAVKDRDRFRFTLLDNERTIRRRPPPGRGLLRNLMQLNMLPPGVLSRTDRLRFFLAWRAQMTDLSALEARIVGIEAYHWAMRRMYDKGKL